VVSLSVSLALEVIGLRKRFTAGIASCRATHDVLRGINLELERGEVAAIVGAAGCGRSTLLLCLAGLMAADEGIIRHFGDDSRGAGIRSTRYHLDFDEVSMGSKSTAPATHLLDLRDVPTLQLEPFRHWLTERSVRGDAAVVVCDIDVARQLTPRVLGLREGRLQETTRAQARVAERRFVDRPFERV
jgi:hypothetical protein